jgi:hypothetical protein
MHRIWIGLEPRQVLGFAGVFVAGTVLVLHIFAFGVVGYPKTTKMKYNPPAVASAIR